MKKNKLVIICALLAYSVNSFSQDLLVFTSKNTKHPVIQDFNTTILPQLNEIAENTESNLKIRYLEDGIPEEVKVLPALFYINESKQKSIYKSAYGSSQRIKTFILQSQVFKSDYESFVKKNVFYSNTNGFEQGINIKITEINAQKLTSTGNFNQQIISGLSDGMNNFRFKESQIFNSWNKQFFLNIYPYLSDDGTYYLSYEIFSQNNCHIPVLKKLDAPIKGKGLSKAAKELGGIIEQNWRLVLEDTLKKDGLYLLDKSKPLKSWKDLGYEFITTQKQSNTSENTLSNGSFSMGKEKLIIFTFAPPADAYSGVIPNFKGSFNYYSNNLKGSFTASLKSLDSGDEDLNSSIIDDQINASIYPTAEITFDAKVEDLKCNEPTIVPAQLHFLNQKKELEIEVSFSTTDQKNSFWVNCDMILNISSYDSLSKPHFDAPINEEVHLHITFKAHLDN